MQAGDLGRHVQRSNCLGELGERFTDNEPMFPYDKGNATVTIRSVAMSFRQPLARRCDRRQNTEAFDAKLFLDLVRRAERAIEVLSCKRNSEAADKAEKRRGPENENGFWIAFYKHRRRLGDYTGLLRRERLLVRDLSYPLQERLVEHSICLCGAFQVLEQDATPAGKIGELLFIEKGRARVNDVVLGLVFSDGSLCVLRLGLKFAEPILYPDLDIARNPVF